MHFQSNTHIELIYLKKKYLDELDCNQIHLTLDKKLLSVSPLIMLKLQ